MTLSYTPLRHKMLADTDRRRGCGQGTSNLWYAGTSFDRECYCRRGTPDLTGPERRALRQLREAGNLSAEPTGEGSHMPFLLALTDEGKALLSSWDAQYGEVEP